MNYDKSKYKKRTWKNFTMLHWIFNPGLAFNELILGQTVPKVLLIDKTSEKPLKERQYVPCPHCESIHKRQLWSGKKGFKNWFGYYCPDCGEIIPCLRNLTSLIILVLTSPLWLPFKKKLKQKWLKKQKERFDTPEEETTNQNGSWLKRALIWSSLMFIIMEIIFPILSGQNISSRNLIIGIPIWALGGLAFSYLLKLWGNKKGSGRKQEEDSTHNG